MSTCLICYPNYIDSAVVTGEGWTDSLPVTNVQTRFLRQVSRTNSAELFSPSVAIPDASQCSAAVHVAFGRQRYLTAIALTGHNLSRGSLARVVLWTDATRTAVKYDFGWQQVWPRWFDTMQLRWGDDNFFYGQPSDDQIGKLSKVYLLLLNTGGFIANATSVQYFSIYLYDPNNNAGYLDVGRVFASEDWCPKINMIYGASLSWVDPSVVDRALDGTKWADARTRYRTAVFQLKHMRPTEGVNKALLLTQLAGITDEVLYIFDPEDKQLRQQRSFVGCLSELSPLEYWTYNLTSMAFKIEESV